MAGTLRGEARRHQEAAQRAMEPAFEAGVYDVSVVRERLAAYEAALRCIQEMGGAAGNVAARVLVEGVFR